MSAKAGASPCRVGGEDEDGEGAAGSLGRMEGVDDEFGAHVFGDRPAGQAPGGEVDGRGRIEELAVGQR